MGKTTNSILYFLNLKNYSSQWKSFMKLRYSYIIPNNYGIFLLDHDATISSNDKKIYQMCILKAVPISSSTYLALVSR